MVLFYWFTSHEWKRKKYHWVTLRLGHKGDTDSTWLPPPTSFGSQSPHSEEHKQLCGQVFWSQPQLRHQTTTSINHQTCEWAFSWFQLADFFPCGIVYPCPSFGVKQRHWTLQALLKHQAHEQDHSTVMQQQISGIPTKCMLATTPHRCMSVEYHPSLHCIQQVKQKNSETHSRES